MDCEICQFSDKNTFWKTEHWKVNLGTDQVYLGRSYIVAKRHCGDLAELSEAEWKDLLNVIQKLENALRKTFGATMFNWTCLMNNAWKNTPPNPHVHWHFRPRYNREVSFAGVTFTDQEFGNHYIRESNLELSEESFEMIKERIGESLKNL